MNPVNWFEIPVNDMERAQQFYETILGLKLDLQEEKNGYLMAWFPMEKDAAGATGSLMKGESYTPSYEGSLVYFSVEDIEGTLQKIEESDGKTIAPKKGIGEYGFIALFEDTEGNRVALHSEK